MRVALIPQNPKDALEEKNPPQPTTMNPPQATTMNPPQPTAAVVPPLPPTTDDGAPPTPTTGDGAAASPKQMEEGGLQESINELSKEYVISIGMEFESEDHAYSFYNDYGKIMGFGIRKDYVTKSRVDGVVINRKFVCSKEGTRLKDKRYVVVEMPRSETRTKCPAFMYITLDRQKSKWIVKQFQESHNHPLHLPQCTYLLRSQSKIF